jgi:acetyl-CoA acyltransferase
VPDAVIVDAVRTPVGRRKGGLAGVHAVDLAAVALDALVARTGLDPAVVDDVAWGCVTQTGEQSANVGRNAVIAAGWPEEVVAFTVDRQCGSSQQAVQLAAALVVSGQCDVVVAGGVEAMSRVPMLVTMTQGPGEPYGPRAQARYEGGLVGQGVSAEMIAAKWNLSRTQCDEIALRSHARAAAAQDSGAFDAELAPVTTPDGVVTADEGVRRGGTLESLGALRTVFKEDGVITAGNSSQISDGASAVLVTTSEKAAEHGWTPKARVHTVATAGVDPLYMLTGPIPATAKVLRRAGMKLDEMDLIEINEAFSSVVGAWEIETGADQSKVNPNGGAIALGHPLGASGGKLIATAIHHLHRTGGRYALVTMCEGGGMANAMILERL